MNEKLNFIREKCIAANPEIMELKFGCKIRVSDIAIIGEDSPLKESSEAFVISYSPGGYNGQDYDGDTLTVWSDEWGRAKRWGDFTGEEMPKYHIFGRPIRLADVLLAINRVHQSPRLIGPSIREGYGCWLRFGDEQGLISCTEKDSWNLREDDLEKQSEETISFLHSLLQ